MKRRILGLVLALCLIVGLLPLSVFAEEPAPTPAALEHLQLKVEKGNTNTTTYKVQNENLKNPVYIKTAANGESFTLDGTESDYNIAIVQTATSLDITLKDAYMKQTSILDMAFWIRFNGDVNITLIGNNKLESIVENSPAAIYVKATGLTTISGTGSLTANSIGWTISNKQIDWNGDGTADYAYDFGCTIISHNAMVIKDVTLNLTQTSGHAEPWASNTLRCGGDLTIDGATLNLDAQKGRGIIMSRSRNKYTDPGNLVIKNGAKVNITAASYGIAVGTGTITIDGTKATDVTIKTDTNAFNKAPTLQNTGAVAGAAKDGTGAATYTVAPGTAPASKEFLYFKTVHVCASSKDDHDCTTVETCDGCGKPIGTAMTHKAAADDGDCTTAVLCANSGCTKVVTAAKTHVAAADDGDCTTAVTCANAGCKHVMTAAKAAHTPAARTDCSVAAMCTTTGCTKVALAAGQHTGGIATCKDKAVCTACKQAYGELGACAPATDDGDCTTAIKCTVCGKETTAAKTHAFANDKDASCDNAGCKHTRTLTTNPSTGDISILLTAAVALTSAVGFAGVTILRKKEN